MRGVKLRYRIPGRIQIFALSSLCWLQWPQLRNPYRAAAQGYTI